MMSPTPHIPIVPKIIVHGGAWDIPAEYHDAHRIGVERACQVGLAVLENRGPQSSPQRRQNGAEGRTHDQSAALRAVLAAVETLENDPTFDAGKGSFLNDAGEVELDAIVMDGRDLSLGSVACVQCVRNPVLLAERVRSDTEHCMLTGEGAFNFARKLDDEEDRQRGGGASSGEGDEERKDVGNGVVPGVHGERRWTVRSTEELLVGRELELYQKLRADPNYRGNSRPFFVGTPELATTPELARTSTGAPELGTTTTPKLLVTSNRPKQCSPTPTTSTQSAISGFSSESSTVGSSTESSRPALAEQEEDLRLRKTKFGTVGAVAIDGDGNIACATSTGGTPNKMKGRVGDTPLPGCGAYCDNRSAGASATGWGESIMRVILAKSGVGFARSGGAQEACQKAIAELEYVDGAGGLIMIDREGNFGWHWNTPFMARAKGVVGRGILEVAV